MAQVESIRRAMHAQPFRPFGIKLASGEVYTVKHPDYIAIPPGPRPREVTFYVEGNRTEDYETHWIDLGLVMEIIVPSESQAAPAQPQA
jgi:hypothetical protein